MILGTRRGVLFNLKEYILPYIDIYTYSYLRRQGQLARDVESATGVMRGVYVQVVPLGSAPTLLPACVIRGLYLIEFVEVDGDFGSREELFYIISWDFAILSVQPLCCVKSSVLSCVLLFQRLRLSRSSSLFFNREANEKVTFRTMILCMGWCFQVQGTGWKLVCRWV